MPNTEEEDLKVERSGHTLVLTLNRPQALNAMTVAMGIAVGDALEDASRNDDIRSVIITGTGRAFCAGADIKESLAGRPELPDRAKTWGFGGYTSHFVSKPTIAAVNGLALGLGMELMLASDLVFAHEKAKFSLPEVKLGTLAAAGGCFRIAQELPRRAAMRLLFTGDSISADEAFEFGLINKVVRGDDTALDAAFELAETINRNAPLAIQAIKRIAYGVGGDSPPDENLWRITKQEQAAILQTADATEGRRAFVEKRQPVWQSR